MVEQVAKTADDFAKSEDVPIENVYVYLDIRIDREKAGRIIIELKNNIAPKTVENFRALCTGEKGIGKSGKKLHYKGCHFHHVIPQFLVQSGDISRDGTLIDDSIYGGPFDDENFVIKHDKVGTVGMANKGKDSNATQFYITLAPCTHLDNSNVAFGYVKKGFNIVLEIAELPRDGDVPLVPCIIEDCGEIKPGEDYQINENDGTLDVYPPYPDDMDDINDHDMDIVVTDIKNSGNLYYKKSNYVDSDRKYKKVLRYIEWTNKKKLKHDTKVQTKLKSQTLFNLASVRLKKMKYKDAFDLCSQVIEIDPDYGKAYYRRGQAALKLRDYDKSIEDFEKAKQYHPDDPLIQKDMLLAKKLKQCYLETEKALCSRMFQQ